MIRTAIVVSTLVAVSLGSGPSFAADAGYLESIEKLKLLYTPAAPAVAEGEQAPAPVPAPVSIDSAEDGTLIITQRTEQDRSAYRFKSVTEQTWRVYPGDLDAKRVAVQDEPMGVFVPAKKEVKRVMVERREAKTRIASADEPGEEWNDNRRFVTSYLVIPAATPQQADQAAALIKQIIKSAPKTSTK